MECITKETDKTLFHAVKPAYTGMTTSFIGAIKLWLRVYNSGIFHRKSRCNAYWDLTQVTSGFPELAKLLHCSVGVQLHRRTSILFCSKCKWRLYSATNCYIRDLILRSW